MTATAGEIARDPTAATEWERPDDRFIPLRAGGLIHTLKQDAKRFGCEPDGLAQVADALRDVIEQEAATFQRQMADFYATFNPDCETLPIGSLDEARTPEAYAELHHRLDYVLEKANFERLSDIDVVKAVRAASASGLRVRLHPNRVDHLELWIRGYGTTERCYRTWRKPIRGEPRTLEVFRRIVVVARLHDTPHVLVKMFKDIPVADIEALLPHAEVEMSWRDRALMLGGGAGTLGTTALKISKIALSFAMLGKVAWIVLVGAAMIAYRTFTGYRRARSARDSQRTKNLYFQNLSNNGAALATLIAMTTQEELKEAVLAYALCHKPDAENWTAAELAKQANAYLVDRVGVHCDFDTADAVETLRRLGLCCSHGLHVLPCCEAAEHLRQHWNQRISAAYHHECCDRLIGHPRREASL